MAKILIRSSHFKSNLDLISSHIRKDKIALVLKDNAYGHGLQEIATLARDYGIKSVFVKNEIEALRIKEYFPHITALYGCISHSAPSNIYQTIHSLQALQEVHPHCGIELKINAGMNRNGIEGHEIDQAIELILKRKLKLIGIFSHNGYGDKGSKGMQSQYQNSLDIKAHIKHLAQTLGFPLPRFHFLSSSSALRQAQCDEDLIRIGIAGYGYLNADLAIASKLKPIASLWAQRISKRVLRQGERVGYDGSGIMPRDGVVSTYDLGYGDGLFRLNEHHPKLHCARGEEILPKISMDCFSCLSGKEEICVFEDAWEWARAFCTTPYEILVKLSPFIPREVI